MRMNVRCGPACRCQALLVAALLAVFSPRAAAAQNDSGHQVASVPRTLLRGVVRDTDGAPVANAHIFAGQANSISTGADGAFQVPGLRHGLLTLLVRRIGFRPSVTQWDLGADTLSLDLRMTPMPTELPAVHVVARAEPFDARLAGFNARLHSHMGYYITRDDIQRRSDRVLTDLLREVPGVRTVGLPRGTGQTVAFSGSHCLPLVFVDGFPAMLGSFNLDQIALDAIEGVEVYPNSSSVPSEFLAPGGLDQCGVVAIWLAPMRPHQRSDRQSEKADLDKLVASGAVYLPDSVDDPATLLPGTTRVQYPDSLLRAGVGGRLTARFVVDTLGRVESGTVDVRASPSPMFTTAVTAALLTSEFNPARVNGHRVRQLVVLPFLFDPAGASAGSAQPAGAGNGGGEVDSIGAKRMKK